MTEDQGAHRRIYARGFYDGVRALGGSVPDGLSIKEYQTMMSQSRFKAVHSGMTNAAKKVYQALPMNEPWTHPQVIAELGRMGSHMEFKMACGCINSLIQVGLATEPSPGKFMRTPIKEGEEKMAKQQPQLVEVKREMSHEQMVPADHLGALSASLRKMSDTMLSVAAQIDMVAIDIEEQLSKNGGDIEKLKQLQALLKSLG